MTNLIYAADDELHTREIIKTFLESAGYNIKVFSNGDLLYEEFLKNPSDMVILDVMMPGNDGLTICTKLRKISKVPIIILTAKDGETDYIMGMSTGSDDYIIKPFRPTMLLMKINAIFKRIEMERNSSQQDDDSNDFTYGDIKLCLGERNVYCRNKNLGLTGTEFSLLVYLARKSGKAVSRDDILQKIWGYESEVETRVTDETIRRIRKKMQIVDSSVKIETIWGYGYRLVV